MHRLKPMFFSQLTLLSNNLVLTSYLGGTHLESWFSWLGRETQKTLKKKKKADRKHWKMKRKKNKEYKESQIITINIFGFNFSIEKYIFCSKA